MTDGHHVQRQPADQQKTAVILGAGPGIGLSVARKFGAEGHRVALVARKPDRLENFAAELRASGIDATAHPADIGDRASLERTLDGILEATGRIDLLYFGPGGFTPGFRPPNVLDATTGDLQPMVDLFVHSAITAVRRVLPGMLARGDGALLFTSGAAARDASAMLGGLSPALAAQRNYALALHDGLAGQGVYAGVLLIGALVDRSEVADAVRADPAMVGGLAVKTVDPDEIAATAWQMTVDRYTAEEAFTGA